ncbi:DUF4190 domain-containing protein [Streptomyces tailanensis]|uniref:DUF4190 domain-containing protein n=1 Tax=Streptomyces tailanensis TaxID=2569858 RepID=UPI00155AB4DD|nr:DUF4190 domain-containing protein [Streptomyces tailanensis]
MSAPSDPDPSLDDLNPSTPQSSAPMPPTPGQQAPTHAPWTAYPAYPYAPPRPTNGLAIASMVLGIVWIYWIGSVLALIFGYVARKQIKERHEGGGGMATAGIVLGWVGVGVLSLLLVAGFMSSMST